MNFRTLVARRADTCRSCNGAIRPGQKIRWAKGRGSYHMSNECPARGGRPAVAASPPVPFNDESDAPPSDVAEHDWWRWEG